MSRMVWDPWVYKYRPVLPQTDGTLISCSSTYVSLFVPVRATAHSIQFYEFGGGSVFQVAASQWRHLQPRDASTLTSLYGHRIDVCNVRTKWCCVALRGWEFGYPSSDVHWFASRVIECSLKSYRHYIYGLALIRTTCTFATKRTIKYGRSQILSFCGGVTVTRDKERRGRISNFLAKKQSA